jgi:hypothetical protein
VNYARIVVRSVPAGSVAPSLESMGFITGDGTLGINNSGPAGYKAVSDIGLNNFSFGDPGTGNAFSQAHSFITSNFTINDAGERSDFHCGLILVP